MPTYEYQCSTCDTTITQVKDLSQANTNPVCVNCQKEMERVFGLQTIIFKGTGWGKDA